MVEKYSFIIGKTPTDAAIELANRNMKMRIRVTSIDGKNLVCTADFCTDRINVAVKDEKIVSIRGIS